jgi:hypothetical protein
MKQAPFLHVNIAKAFGDVLLEAKHMSHQNSVDIVLPCGLCKYMYLTIQHLQDHREAQRAATTPAVIANFAHKYPPLCLAGVSNEVLALYS